MNTKTTCRIGLPLRGLLVVVLLMMIGCSEKWEYGTLRDVQTSFPSLADKQYARRREYSEAEMVAVQAGGTQTILIARSSKPATVGDVAQLDENVSHTFILALDGPLSVGKTYRITPDNGRVIESTTFRPAWRPYRGLEGEVTVLAASGKSIKTAVRVTALTLRQTDPERSLRGALSFKVLSGGEPFIRQAQINLAGGVPTTEPAEK